MRFVFGYGPWLLSNAWHAAEELQRTTGASIRVVNLPWLNRVDPGWLRQTIGESRTVMTLDNHYLQEGRAR
jgi:transketolase